MQNWEMFIFNGELCQKTVGKVVAIYYRELNQSSDNNLGNALQKQGKFEEAIETYHKAIEIQPEMLKNCPNRVNGVAIESYP